jgi:Zn-dependent protease
MSPDGIPIGRLFGIEIRVSLAWAVVIAIITILGAEQAVIATPELSFVLQWAIGGAVAAAFLVSVVAHELAHALVARRRGVRSTVIVLGFIGGLAPLGIQAQRPVDELAIAVSGPLLSILLALAVVPLGVLIGTADQGLGAIAGGLIIVGGLNLILGVVSLLPGLPLDGGRIVRALAWARSGDRDRATRVTASIGRIVGWLTIGTGVAIAFMDRTTEGLLVLSLGWLLSTGARTLDRRLGMEQLLRGVPVSEAMEPDVAWIGPNLTIDTFASRYEGEDGVSALAVVDDDRVVGVLGVRRVRRLGRRKFADTRVADVMTTPPQAPLLAPDDDLWDALDLINQSGLDGLAVAEDGRLAGMLTRRSLGNAVRTLVAARGGAAG